MKHSRFPLSFLAFALVASPAAAQQLDVDFSILEDDQAAGCLVAHVAGLDQGGDGFLAVRTGPGSDYTKIDEVHNGDRVRSCVQQGQWHGIYYGDPRRKGWAHGNWLKVLDAG